MKRETNNEMDLLLRRLGRRDETTVFDADHLDADELSAYAENALPGAARLRYTAHLAECSRCRSLIVQLSSAAGVVATTESAAVPAASGLKKFLASLFTPMVLRYAVPALGLIVVAVIGFVVLRRNEPAKNLAENIPLQQRPNVAPAASPVDGLADSSSKSAPSPENRVERQDKNQPAQAAPPPNTPPSVSSVEADVATDKAAAQPKPQEQTASANEAPPAPKSEPTTQEDVMRTPDKEVSKKEARELPVAEASPAKTLQSADRKDNDNFARARKSGGIASAPAAGAGSVASIQRDGLRDVSPETRTVAGRRFRKQDGIWTDTAYDRSQDPVTLRRGSEQYRSLVADEPAIQTIADTLDGEIIVVWKGRPYRIR